MNIELTSSCEDILEIFENAQEYDGRANNDVIFTYKWIDISVDKKNL